MEPEIRVAIIGAGNCAAALTAGLEYYKSRQDDEGIIFSRIGPYNVRHIRPVVAFDIDARKVNLSLGKALNSEPICVTRPPTVLAWEGVPVLMGPKLDGSDSQYLSGSVKGIQSCQSTAKDVAQTLAEFQVDVAINYLPVGSTKAAEFYAEQCLAAGVAFCNCMPAFIVSDPIWDDRFVRAGVPTLGDDIKSQFGATILHRALAHLAQLRGVKISRTYQLNVGGNSDFLNMLDRGRLKQKLDSKRGAVISAMGEHVPENVHVGPSDFVEWLNDNKICFIHAELGGFADSVAHLDLRLSIEDSPNSAGCVVDAVRFLQLARDQGTGGALRIPSAFLMKSPPESAEDAPMYQLCQRIADGEIPAGTPLPTRI